MHGVLAEREVEAESFLDDHIRSPPLSLLMNARRVTSKQRLISLTITNEKHNLCETGWNHG
ncbi:hypothetical protein J416_07667 [Gracilibacillus halophilus YIM-C55.5]|uniref:Uncharacterized protein n=1 Tax=Gracilibacillus halophilus YIM-C55.5 TaxID=1308866 RepID=N4WVH6_9BACI|nr:hypothetical protein J416_07667 [Gracilibacillus halophilus YIM-C55.5]